MFEPDSEPQVSSASEPPQHSNRAWKAGFLSWPPMLHPLLAPLPCLLAFTHDNNDLATWRSIGFPLLVSWLCALPLWVAFAALGRNPRTAAVCVTAIVVAFYAHRDAGAWATWMWVAVALNCVGLVLWRGSGKALTTFVNLLLLLTVLPLLRDTWNDARHTDGAVPKPGYLDALPITATPRSDLPDIWYIVLDGYGRADVLQDEFGLDDGFVEFLRSRGFYVADAARSNYCQTALSFASSLNMAPLSELLSDVRPSSRNRQALSQLIADNRVVHALREAGYRIVEYPGEYSVTRLADPDESRAPWVRIDEFVDELLLQTPIFPLTRLFGQPQGRLSHAIRRHTVSWTFDQLARGDRDPGPTFVFAHIVAPHPPFVFAADGSYRPARSRSGYADGSTWKRSTKSFHESYADGYLGQVQYVNMRLREVVDGILAHSERPPVVLLQGDHGPGLHLDWGSREHTDLRERMGILSAYRVPDPSRLYPTITPMNSFRVVLDEVIGTELPLIEDRSWFTTWSRPFAFMDVTATNGAE